MTMRNKKYNTIDLFAGCGGLMDGFMLTGHYKTISCVEWDKYPCLTIENRLRNKWGHTNSSEEVIRFDIQRTDELINGFDDAEYGKHVGLKKLIGRKKVDLIIGGPPCQAYSLAGRIRDPHGMKLDYRNYLFESYIKILENFKPSFFVFENVVGMLSAAPDGTPIIHRIKHSFEQAGYAVINDFKNAVYDVADFGIPQHRKRVIIFGVRKDIHLKANTKYKDKDERLSSIIIDDFYNQHMPNCKKNATKKNVRDAIGDLPPITPLTEILCKNGQKYSHGPIESHEYLNHIPRFHSSRDQKIFRLLEDDIQSGRKEYVSTESLKKLYTQYTGKTSNIHKYYVLRWDEPSNTIPAHLFKDGMRHIHPDPQQARSITVREAARLQTFADDFEFIGPMMAQYKMIGNAVPPEFARIIANTIYEIMTKYC